jgi:hypothetical protein
VTLSRPVVVAAALGWLVFEVPHLVYHLRHTDVYDASDKVATIAALVLAVVLPAVVLVAVVRDPRRTPG